tara:strand:- start:30975 stop:31535 length:561 start_codon:yes stop_codon:yes gene_type:complete
MWRELVDYCPSTGALRWKVKVSQRQIGQRADTRGSSRGYRQVVYRGRKYLAHRIIFALINGEGPRGYVDHINGNPSDNRAWNLRGCEQWQNSLNGAMRSDNTTKFKGVSAVISGGTTQYRAAIKNHGRTYFLGLFDSKESASAAYQGAARVIGGGFFSDGDRRQVSPEQEMAELRARLAQLEAQSA